MKHVVRDQASMSGTRLSARDVRRLIRAVTLAYPDATTITANKAFCSVYVESPSLPRGWTYLGWEEIPDTK